VEIKNFLRREIGYQKFLKRGVLKFLKKVESDELKKKNEKDHKYVDICGVHV